MNPKKPRIVAIILVILAVITVTVQARASEGPRLMILGDSIAAGWGLTFPGMSFGSKLAAELGSSQYINHGLIGLDTKGLLDMLRSGGIAGIENQDIIIVSIGGNDIYKPFLEAAKRAVGLDPSASEVELGIRTELFPETWALIAAELNSNKAVFEKAVADYFITMQGVLMELRSKNPTALIYALNHYNPVSGFGSSSVVYGFMEELIKEMNAHLQRLLGSSSFGIVDIYSGFHGNAGIYTNPFSIDAHPNAPGHALIFERVYAAVLSGEQSAGNAVSGLFPMVTELVKGIIGVMTRFIGFMVSNIIIFLPFLAGLLFMTLKLLGRMFRII
jgi:lysophospholipase L1-like esterase